MVVKNQQVNIYKAAISQNLGPVKSKYSNIHSLRYKSNMVSMHSLRMPSGFSCQWSHSTSVGAEYFSPTHFFCQTQNVKTEVALATKAALPCMESHFRPPSPSCISLPHHETPPSPSVHPSPSTLRPAQSTCCYPLRLVRAVAQFNTVAKGAPESNKGGRRSRQSTHYSLSNQTTMNDDRIPLRCIG